MYRFKIRRGAISIHGFLHGARILGQFFGVAVSTLTAGIDCVTRIKAIRDVLEQGFVKYLISVSDASVKSPLFSLACV
jgi:hypothetical protein